VKTLYLIALPHLDNGLTCTVWINPEAVDTVAQGNNPRTQCRLVTRSGHEYLILRSADATTDALLDWRDAVLAEDKS
jgi:hypothetical protein